MKLTKIGIIIINLCLLFYINFLSKKINTQKKQLNEFLKNIEVLKNKNEYSENCFLNNMINDGFIIPKSNYRCNNNVLIYRYTDLNCQECIDSNIKVLKQNMDSIGVNNINIWTFYNNKRDYALFLRNNQFKFHIEIIETVNIPMEKLNLPYLFVLDKEGKINDIFIPMKEFPELTNKYLKIIKRKYFEKGISSMN